ncbi:MAG: hypothetical protein QOH95_664 [Gaiellaceae bacterium]|jgi:hypothetical protein|nr:hypothetical protein [Gaiellaceae bacterium]
MPFVLSTAWIKEGKSDRLREWYGELASRSNEAFETLDNEGIRQEIAFILDTEHGELLCVFLEVEKDMKEADAAFFSSPFEIDHQHMAVMDDTTEGGARGRKYAQLMYALKNPADGKREVYVPD